MVVYLPLLVSLVGLVLYALSQQPKPAEVGRLMFWCGLLSWLLRHGYTVNPLK
jgi:hypothetical protein